MTLEGCVRLGHYPGEHPSGRQGGLCGRSWAGTRGLRERGRRGPLATRLQSCTLADLVREEQAVPLCGGGLRAHSWNHQALPHSFQDLMLTNEK